MKKYIIAFTTLLIFIIGYILLFKETRENTLIKEGDKIVEKVICYYTKNNRLPNTLTEIDIEEKIEGPIFYKKKDSINFILWFGTELGESRIYYSDIKKWEEKYR